MSVATSVREATPVSVDPDEEIVGYVRSASDLLRLAVFLAATLLLLALARWGEDTLVGVERDLLDLFDFLAPAWERALSGLAQLVVAVIAIAVYIPAFVTHRFRLLGYILLGNIVTGLAVEGITEALDRGDISKVVNEVAARAGIGAGGLGPGVLGQLACSFVILAPFVSRAWRRTGALLIAVLTLVRLLVSSHLPAELIVSLTAGASVGCVVLLVFGRPDRRPSMASIRAGLAAAGLPAAVIERAPVDARGSRSYVCGLADGSEVFVKALSPEERSADLLYRLYRFLRLKNVGDERPFSSLRRTVEHEALVTLLARDRGVCSPRLRSVAAVGSDSMLLAHDFIPGTPLDQIPPGDVDDAFLEQVWAQVEVLHRTRIAHRDLRLANVIVDVDGKPWLVGFRVSEVAASDRLLAADVAQLLAGVAMVVGARRAAQTALAALGVEPVADALPLLQPGALPGQTRAALRAHHGLLDELRGEVQEQSGVPAPELAHLERFNRRRVFLVVTLALATYFLIPQFANVPEIARQVADADWAWFVPVVAMATVTYIGATTGISGAVPERLALIPTFITQVASDFASALAPAGLGGMALNTRFIQKSGVDPAVAVSSVGLNAVSGVCVHLGLLVAFAVWAGRDAFGAIHLPDPAVLLYGLAAVLVLAVIGFSIPALRRQVLDRLVPILRRSVGGLAGTLRRPVKLALVLGGSALVSLGYISALFFSIQAFGGSSLTYAQVGAIYLAASAVAAAAPTPGGLGALEAAVIAGLVAAGVPNQVAVPAVFLYRLATFWVPLLPGWIAFQYLQRAEYV
jgi:undecaprenyl-diphosphatase